MGRDKIIRNEAIQLGRLSKWILNLLTVLGVVLDGKECNGH